MAVPVHRPADRSTFTWAARGGRPGRRRGLARGPGRRAGRLAKLGFGATLIDLAARGWFEVHAPAGPAGQAGWGPAGPVMCVIPAETPGGPLAPFERRVVAHVALRAGARGEVPAPALSDGFGGGETAALGAAPAAVAVFAPAKTNTAWSSYRGGWQQIEIETNTWPWPRACVILLAIMVAPIVYVGAAIWLGTHGMAVLAEELVALVVVAAFAGVGVWLARRTLLARFAEFDGQVIRQWVVKGDSESPDQHHVAIDDGTREKAWDLQLGSEPYRLLTPGTFVHARVNGSASWARVREQGG